MLDKVVEWHKKARPTPDDAAFNVQLGWHLEEVVEMLVVLAEKKKNRTCSDTAFLLDDCTSYVGRLASRLKRGVATLVVADRKDFLDSLADQVVTAAGVAHCAGMDIEGALDRVNASNWSKFDENGEPIFDDNGKIKKGPQYAAPNLDGLF